MRNFLLNMDDFKNIIIACIGRTLESPADFEYLSEQIQNKTGEYLSPTTLKRFFGYIPYDGQLRPSTLSILARYAGYNGWQDYQDKQQIESGFTNNKRITINELSQGQKLLIEWNPNRQCIAEYLGDNRFVVIYSKNCTLQIGDRFCTTQFMLGQPLTATDLCLIRNTENTPKTYVAGVKTGLTKIEIINV